MKKQVMEGQSMPSDALLLLTSVNLNSSNREGSAVVEGMNSGSQMTSVQSVVLSLILYVASGKPLTLSALVS